MNRDWGEQGQKWGKIVQLLQFADGKNFIIMKHELNSNSISVIVTPCLPAMLHRVQYCYGKSSVCLLIIIIIIITIISIIMLPN